MATAVRSKSITITASAGIVIDYIDCALNTILYLRGIYPASQYKTIQKYGLSIQMSTDPEVQHYLKNNLSQIKKWIIKDEFIRLCLVIKDAEGTEVENYEFRVQKKDDPNNRKEKRTIDAEIGAILRSIIVACQSHSRLDSNHQFIIKVYRTPNSPLPYNWTEHEHVDFEVVHALDFGELLTGLHQVNSREER